MVPVLFSFLLVLKIYFSINDISPLVYNTPHPKEREKVCDIFFLFIYRSPGYAVVPQVQRPLSDSNNIELDGEQAAPNGQPQYFPFTSGPANLSFTQFPQNLFVPFQPREGTVNITDGLGSSQNVPGSQLEAQERFLQQQIEVCYLVVASILPGDLSYALLGSGIPHSQGL